MDRNLLLAILFSSLFAHAVWSVAEERLYRAEMRRQREQLRNYNNIADCGRKCWRCE